MLIFFLVAGKLAPARDPRLTLVNASDLVAIAPPDGLLVLADGTLLQRGQNVTAVEAGAAGGAVRIVPDRALPADRLIALARALKEAGASDIIIVAERSVP
jgi:biopolymer transport protein ExbD